MDVILYFFLGVMISVLGGFFGVGGGIILTPILLLTGFSPLVAITTSLLFTIGTSVSGIIAHLKMKNILWKEGLLLGLSGVVASRVANPFVYYLDKKGWDETVIPVFYAILLAYFAISLMKRGRNVAVKQSEEVVKPSVVKIILIGLFGGFVSNTLGVGGGFIMVPLSIALLGFAPKKAVGTSLFAALSIVSLGFITYSQTVSVNYQIGLLLIAGALVGSQFGAKLTAFYKNNEISIMLSLLYVATFTSVVLKLFNLSIVGLCVISLFAVFFFTRAIIRVMRKEKVPSEN